MTRPRSAPKTDTARQQRLAILTKIERMLVKAMSPAFTGAVRFEVHSGGGKLAVPSYEVKRSGEVP